MYLLTYLLTCKIILKKSLTFRTCHFKDSKHFWKALHIKKEWKRWIKYCQGRDHLQKYIFKYPYFMKNLLTYLIIQSFSSMTNDITTVIINTVFPHIVSAETILFWLWPYVLWPLITVHKFAESIQGRKLFKGRNYMRKYGRYFEISY